MNVLDAEKLALIALYRSRLLALRDEATVISENHLAAFSVGMLDVVAELISHLPQDKAHTLLLNCFNTAADLANDRLSCKTADDVIKRAGLKP